MRNRSCRSRRLKSSTPSQSATPSSEDRARRRALEKFVSKLAAGHLTLALALLAGSSALGENASSVFNGSWTATAGSAEVFRGAWTTQILPGRPNAAQGSWTLLSGGGDVLLQGTWSARKTGQGWKGTWVARTLPGRALSRTWTAAVCDPSAKLFQDMLQLTTKVQVAGSWRSGRYQGNWWLSGPPHDLPP
jgi:hypothetical protein